MTTVLSAKDLTRAQPPLTLRDIWRKRQFSECISKGFCRCFEFRLLQTAALLPI